MSGRYYPYDKYESSGVQWLGDIPKGWTVARLKQYADVTDGSHHSPAIQHEGYPFISVTEVGRDDIDFDDCKRISEIDYQRLVRDGNKPEPGNVLVTKDGTIGRAIVVDEFAPPFVILSSLGMVSGMRNLHAEFLRYFLVSGICVDQMNSLIHGSALRRLTVKKINELVVLFPCLTQQKQISAFLDYETAKIDALIEKQQQLIALLGEKRQAVISHAVTKGLNPDAPMRDSGIEWLGEVPEHWKVVNLNVVAEIGNGSTPDRSTPRYWGEQGDFPWLNSSVVNQDVVDDADQFVTESALRECHLPHIMPPAVLVGITGQGKTRGMATILQIEATINQHVTFIQPRDERVTVPFIHRFFEMAYDHIRFESEGAGSTKGAITCGQLEKTKIPLPPSDEQTQIVDHLSDFSAKISELIHNAEDANELLQERRTALISAAVTGKIDVRGWKPPSSGAKQETEMEVA